jgi:DNA-binding winged helix-turn-helix (wHTH) protein
MDEKDFILQQRFEIRPTASAVVDTLLQKEMKLEPRLMKLLCMLAKQPGQLVKREQLISEIWNDYGGGEAGLTHAISTLRKLLDDTSKDLIETIPTKGYILHAAITELKPITDRKMTSPLRMPKRTILYASITLLAALILYFLLPVPLADEKEEDGSLQKRALHVPFEKVNHKTEETWLNTIITVGEDSTVYKLKVIGDSRPEFYVNGRLLPPDEMEKHLDLIYNLEKQLKERSH